MIARCPECQTRFRLAREKIGAQGARIRCSRCNTIFRVEAPPADVEPVVVAQEVKAEPAPTPPPVAKAIVAEADAEVAKGIAALLESYRIEVEVINSGGEALLRIFRQRPELAVLGGHLPGLQAPAIAEIIRRSTDTQEMSLIRIAPMDERAGAPEFDADETLEPGDLPDGLAALLESIGVGKKPETPEAQPPAPTAAPAVANKPLAPTPPAPTPPVPVPAAPATPAPVPAAPAPPAAAAVDVAPSPPARRRSRRSPPLSSDPEIAAAERLARIAISDIILYNEDKFAAAVRSKDVAGALENELNEARHMFKGRIPENIREKCDFLAQELERRAAQKREQA